MPRLLVTGAAGRIGSALRPLLARPGRTLVLHDRVDQQPVQPGEDVELVRGDLSDLEGLTRAAQGADGLLHLGGVPSEAPWEVVEAANVTGTRNALEAARRAGARRAVLASSIHAVGMLPVPPPGELVPGDAAPCPDTYYGMSKAAVEALGALYAARFGMSVVSLRISTFAPAPPDRRSLATWLSVPDAARLVEAALSAPLEGHRIVWGVSRNTHRYADLSGAQALGYDPQDDAEDHADALRGLDPAPDRVGGSFAFMPVGES